jgi:excisionase family DNA binding protein
VTSEQPHGVPVVHTMAEAASILRVKESWLEKQAAARKIPFTMLGGCYRFTAGHLAEIIRLNEQVPSTPAGAESDRPRSNRRAPQSETASVSALRPRTARPRRRAA